MSTKVKPPRWVVGLVVIGTAVHLTTAADFFEDFSHPPDPVDWHTHGEASLFHWNAGGHLEVTWDSSQTNSYFFHPLGTILGKDDDFTLAFDLTLTSIAAGVRPDKPDTFEIAIGLLNLADATNTNFFRGQGTGIVKNLFELDYFPDNGLGTTVWPAAWSTNGVLSYRDSGDYTLIELPPNQVLHVTLAYTAADHTLQSVMVSDGLPIGPIHDLVLSPTFTDFRVNAFAICSYSDEGTSGSLFATGEIDNVRLTTPPSPVDLVSLVQDQNEWQLQFASATNWFYQAEFTSDFIQWTLTGSSVEGSGGQLKLPVTINDEIRFWRIRATRP